MAKTTTKNTRVGLKDLRENMEKYITAVNQGATLTIFRRSTPLFTISPVGTTKDEQGWEIIVDFRKEFGEGMPLSELMDSIKAYGSKRKVS